MNMREAFENYYGGDKRRSVRHPETYIDFTTQTALESFEAGYAAAIEAVKAGGVAAHFAEYRQAHYIKDFWYKILSVGQPASESETIRNVVPLYKLPEDV